MGSDKREIEFKNNVVIIWKDEDPSEGPIEFRGEWWFADNKGEIHLNFPTGEISWKIRRLTNNQLWVDWDGEDFRLIKQ